MRYSRVYSTEDQAKRECTNTVGVHHPMIPEQGHGIQEQSEVAFQEFMRTKMVVEKDKVAAERHPYMMFLKTANVAITNKELEIFKDMYYSC